MLLLSSTKYFLRDLNSDVEVVGTSSIMREVEGFKRKKIINVTIVLNMGGVGT